MVSQKCQYAIRAAFELSRRYGQGPVKIGDIAEAQAIPLRFLQVILNQLRRAGFVESKRGADGGYLLARQPDRVTAGDIVRFVEGPLVPIACMISAAAADIFRENAVSQECGSAGDVGCVRPGYLAGLGRRRHPNENSVVLLDLSQPRENLRCSFAQ